MSKAGIKIIEETVGSGPMVTKTDRVQLVFDMQLSGGDYLIQATSQKIDLSRRDIIAGLRYGVEGMREGGTRKFKASPHLCYRDDGVADRIPKNAALVITIKAVKILGA